MKVSRKVEHIRLKNQERMIPLE